MKSKKHDHSLTKWLKGIIFGILILMPVLIFLPNAFYYGFNEQAIAQEKTEQVPIYYESNEITQISDFHIGNIYQWNDNFQRDTNIPNNTYFVLSYTDNLSTYGISENDTSISIFIYNGYLYLKSSQSDYITILDKSFYFVILSYGSGLNSMPNSVLEHFSIFNENVIKTYQPLTTTMSITDSMSTAWETVWQNDLFSWVDDTAIYTVVNNMTTLIQISSNSYLANYLTYIFLFTVIYVIVDIILGVFTMITHLFNKEPK